MPSMQYVPLRGRRRVITSVRTQTAALLSVQAFAVLVPVEQAFAALAFAALASDLPSSDHPSFVLAASQQDLWF